MVHLFVAFVLQVAAFSPVFRPAFAPVCFSAFAPQHRPVFATWHRAAVKTAAPVMREKQVLKQPTAENIRNLLLVWAAIGAIGWSIASSGRPIGIDNAPGYAEIKVKKDSEKEAGVKERTARIAFVSERAAADKAAGRAATAPPKPWEVGR